MMAKKRSNFVTLQIHKYCELYRQLSQAAVKDNF